MGKIFLLHCNVDDIFLGPWLIGFSGGSRFLELNVDH